MTRSRHPTGQKSNAEELAIQEIVDCLMRDSNCPMPEKETLARFGLTEYRLKQGFKRMFQMTPGAWLRRERLRQASLRLINSPDKVADIALSYGYRNPSRFAEAFRAEFGLRPVEFRKQVSPDRRADLNVPIEQPPVPETPAATGTTPIEGVHEDAIKPC
jgi:AraC-like DNA-binding protein